MFTTRASRKRRRSAARRETLCKIFPEDSIPNAKTFPPRAIQWYREASGFMKLRGSRARDLGAWAAVVASAALLSVLIIGAPWLARRGNTLLAESLRHAFSVVCHQRPERSFYLWGYPLAVCARCTGIYLGAFCGALIYPLLRSLRDRTSPARRWLILSAVPLALDWGLGFSHVLENSSFSRCATGLLFGFALAFYVVPGLLDLRFTMETIRQMRADQSQGAHTL
ncbi:MAG: hypothetical protein C4334_14940 [Pyrinomonas sp.]